MARKNQSSSTDLPRDLKITAIALRDGRNAYSYECKICGGRGRQFFAEVADVRKAAREHWEATHEGESQDHAYHPTTGNICGRCGMSVHAHSAFKRRQEMRDRIGADIVRCADCGTDVPADKTVRRMSTEGGRVVNVRVCTVTCAPGAATVDVAEVVTPLTEAEQYKELALRHARGQMSDDDYEQALLKLDAL